jgi:hypothetical protein
MPLFSIGCLDAEPRQPEQKRRNCRIFSAALSNIVQPIFSTKIFVQTAIAIKMRKSANDEDHQTRLQQIYWRRGISDAKCTIEEIKRRGAGVRQDQFNTAKTLHRERSEWGGKIGCGGNRQWLQQSFIGFILAGKQ